jgi:hypothetical protein
MESHGNEFNSLVGNDIELGVVILMIKTRTSVGIEVTKGMRLDVMVEMMITYS